MADQETTNTEGTETAGLDAVYRAPKESPESHLTFPETHMGDSVEDVKAPIPSSQGASPTVGESSNDITRIIENVKLPERKEFRAIGDVPVVPIEAQYPVPDSPAITSPEPVRRDIISAVHTLKDDFQTAVQDQKISVVQAAALQEQKRARQIKTYDSPDDRRAAEKRQGLKSIVAVLAIACIGIAALGVTLLFIQGRTKVEPTTFLVDGLLFSEQTIPLPLDSTESSELRRQIATARTASDLTLGAITRVAPVFETRDQNGKTTMNEASTREFLDAIDANVPEELLRALGDEFFFGFHTVDENAPILILPVTSYERAFAGVLAWEKTMNADVSPIFTTVPPLVQKSDGLIVERKFEDIVMRNYDVRALKDDTGVIQLYYSFPTRGILIIAESPYSFAEVLSRLRADRRL